MSVDTPAQAGVSIEALLAAKEQRAARQAGLVGPLSAACYFPDPGDPGGR
ncbi:phosphoribosyl-dephospho-CoA transferase [Klebsiella pneumoniae]|uniref:Phosphoribosyl-dephospho-CoA transferase n=1 Tax=Klebsiella pneumoniae TaxID=573 RepID=A0A3S4GQL0_KLEPN|nr:phosphoribosyl-dephospho-CoA transferase [Klebsiella pneumoniae]